ncbi:MAG: tetratricopeptide repeat protein [Candidatus Paceibacterota bacterium]|jgi:tetratricopeptide (TPR) repeat protein
MNESKNVAFLSKASFYTLLATILLIPVFFLPFINVSFDTSKGALLFVGTLVSLSFWIIARLIDGKFEIPKDNILLAALSIPVVFLLSSIFSPAPMASLFGHGFEMGTFISMLILFVLMFLSSMFFRSKERVSYLYFGILLGAFLIAVFQMIRLFVDPSTLSLGFFSNTISNTIGSWNDLAIFFGLSGILALVTLEFLTLKKNLKIFLYVILGFSLFFLALINLMTAWIILGSLSLILFIYGLSVIRGAVVANMRDENGITRPQGERPFPLAAFIVTFICLLFIFGNNFVGDALSSYFKVSTTDVRPSLTATIQVAGNTLSHNPVFGAGPGRFVNEWLANKPDAVNNTIFWDTNFIAGFGLIPSFLVTTGILGILAFLILLGIFFYRGFKAIFVSGIDQFSLYLIISSFICSLYLWIFSFVYIPSSTLFILAFAMTGVFIGVLVHKQIIPLYDFSFLSDPRNSFFSILALVLLMIVSIAGLYKTAERFAGEVYFGQGIINLNIHRDLDKTESNILHAIQLNDIDTYYRGLSELYLTRLAVVISDNNKDFKDDTVRANVQQILGKAEASAQLATTTDKTNYLNWVSLGKVYESVVPLKVSGAYENAKASYEKAITFNTKSPALLLMLANLEIENKNNSEARKYIDQALQMKQNYTEAIFLLSQIEASEGNLDAAIIRAAQALFISPNDVGIALQLGLLKYNNKDYTGAASALERAVALYPDYLNARYFLGLSYDKLGRTGDALYQFNYINIKSPDNQSIKDIIANLQVGNSAFNSLPAPETKPEKGKTLPVKEKTN